MLSTTVGNDKADVQLKDKYKKRIGEPAVITVAVEGAVRDYATLRHDMTGVHGVLFDDINRRIYAPLEQTGLLYVGVEYER
jgi:hypothetical protein